MFSRTSLVALVALPLLATANAVPRGAGEPSGQCNTGSLQCCNNVGTASTLLANVVGAAGLLAGFVGPVEAVLGINCTPISVIGIGGNSCTAQPVCCTGNTFNGVVNVGCSPINLNL
ncbi:hypothetical protein CVT25_010603 [Psilocybe cyanescens]|uniref:Hydrophobin n=1 Tax=Psilocybe cyanescens TaxID=93625 RepID=A0A409WJH1_PSICY|nr:hypothetical protein CVT25_010603 [Psilocybe cyanescens]